MILISNHIISNPIPVNISLQCKLVRDYYIANPKERRRLSEKARASSLFKGKKSLYPKTLVE